MSTMPARGARASGAPRLGGTMGLSLGGASPSTPGLLVMSPDSAVSLPLAQGCTAFVDLAAAVPLLPLTTDGAGAWSASFPIPRAPFAAGLVFTGQAAVTPTAAPFRIDLSDGLEWTLGY